MRPRTCCTTAAHSGMQPPVTGATGACWFVQVTWCAASLHQLVVCHMSPHTAILLVLSSLQVLGFQRSGDGITALCATQHLTTLAVTVRQETAYTPAPGPVGNNIIAVQVLDTQSGGLIVSVCVTAGAYLPSTPMLMVIVIIGIHAFVCRPRWCWCCVPFSWPGWSMATWSANTAGATPRSWVLFGTGSSW
jgi:hypothetical protein